MGVSGNSIAGKSFQSFAISEELLAKVTEAVQAGEKQARSSGNIQSFEVFYRGLRMNIAIGRIYIIPASVCSDRKDFPTALLYGCLVREFGGEEMSDMIEKKIGDSEFDEYSQADFDTIKEKLFGSKGDSLVLFAPAWVNKREFIVFKFTKDEGKLKNNLRHQVFSAYYDPALSSAFNAIMTNVNTTKIDVTDITPKLNFPYLAENVLTQYPDLQKQASKKTKVFLTRRTADAVTKEVLDPQELDVFESLDQALSEAIMPGVETVEEAGEPSEGGFNSPDAQNEVPRLANATEQSLDPKKFPKKPEDKEENKEAAGNPQDKWLVFLNGKQIDAVYHQPKADGGAPTTAEDVKRGLVEHDGYNAGIVVKKACLEGEAPIGIAIDENGVPRSEAEAAKVASAWGKVAGKEFKTAKVKLTFGTNNVYFDMEGTKYMLEGMDAESFLNEWLPIYNELKSRADAERDSTVERLAKKYMSKMQKRPTKQTKSPAPAKIDVAPEVSEPSEMITQEKFDGAHMQHASKEASADAFTPVNKKDKVHPGNLKDADVIAAIDEKKWGNATIPLNFGKRQGGVPTVKSAAGMPALDAFTQGYLDAALWTEEENLNEEMGKKEWGQESLAKETIQQMIGVCKNFQHDNATLLHAAYDRPGYNEAHAGHDFWLTRNGHGAGYWDRNQLEEGGLGDQLSVACKQYGESDLYVGDDGRIYSSEGAEATPQHEMDFHASYIAAKMGKIVDPVAYDAASLKTKQAREDRESKLAKNRQKQADVPMDIDSIWAEITEDMGPAPQIDLPGDSGSGGAAADGGGESKSEGSSDGRPRKSDIGKLPKEMTSDEPEEEKAMSDSEADDQEDSMPEPEQHKSESESDEEKWHVSSAMEDFVKEAFEDDGGFTRRETRPEPDFTVDADFIKQLAQHAIEIDADVIYDVASNVGQIVGNVKHMPWFTKAIEAEIAGDEDLQQELAASMQAEHEPDFVDERAEDDLHEASVQWEDTDDKKKKADAVQPDVAEAKSEVVSPDTVDADIHQETKSVEEAAKVGGKKKDVVSINGANEKCADCGVKPGKEHKKDCKGGLHDLKKKSNDVSGDVAEAKSEVVSPDTVDSTIHQETKSVEEAAKVGAQVSNEGQCPHCNSYDTDEVDAEEGTHLYCHNCEQLSTVAESKIAAAGDDMPEEVPFDFGAGDLADIVMSEEDTDGAKE